VAAQFLRNADLEIPFDKGNSHVQGIVERQIENLIINKNITVREGRKNEKENVKVKRR
jgi:hypothetical protein